MRSTVLLLAVLSAVVPCRAHAQTDFSATTLAPGQLVRVTEPSGNRLDGVVTAVTPASLSVAGRVFQPQAGLKVERLGDPTWDGAAVGFAAGALLGASKERTGCFTNKSVGCVVKPGLVFAGIAALVDRAILGRRTVFLGTPVDATAFSVDWSRRSWLVTFSY
jgi:hypothetical protein